MSEPQAEAKKRRVAETAAALAAVYAAAKAEALVRGAAGNIRGALDHKWRGQLERVVRAQALETVRVIGPLVAESFDLKYWTPNRAAALADEYLTVMAHEMAGAWEQLTEQALAELNLATANIQAEIQAAMRTGENLSGVDGENVTESAANLSTLDAAKASGKTTKTWHLGTVHEHRASHVAQNGTTVGISDKFPNGQQFPGSPAPPAERVNCECFLTFGG